MNQAAVACPSAHPCGGGVLASLAGGHQQFDGPADLGDVLRQRDLLLEFHQPLIAFLHNRFGQLIGELGGRGARDMRSSRLRPGIDRIFARNGAPAELVGRERPHVDATDAEHVRLYFSAPAEAPTTRGFASILAAGLDGQSAEEILAVPDDFYSQLGLAALISPLRLRGMAAMLARIKRLARSRYLNYQSMIKQWLSERMEEELK